MNLLSRDAGTYALETNILCLAYRIIDLTHFKGCLALQDGAGHICIVPAHFGARKDIDDNGSIGSKWSNTSHMRICSVRTAGVLTKALSPSRTSSDALR